MFVNGRVPFWRPCIVLVIYIMIIVKQMMFAMMIGAHYFL